jgi:hypothetical protein
MTILLAGPYCRAAFHGNYCVSNPDHRCFMAIGKSPFHMKYGPKNLLSILRITGHQKM